MIEETRDRVACTHCHSLMEVLRVKKYPGGSPTVLMVGGGFCCLFFIGAVVGIPMLILGIYMATAKETISRCPKCGHYFKMWVGEGVSV